jgi:uncharacterized membrane protein YGL010W
MKTLTEQLSQYAAYHRDSRNIATHFVGIPMIVVAVAILPSRLSVEVAGLSLSPTSAVVLALVAYYLRLDLRLGLVMGLLFVAAHQLGAAAALLPLFSWLALGLGLFLLGWVIQFVGHYFEGRKPAFVDDLVGLAIGPLFVVAELGFLLGLRRTLRADIEARVGPTRRGRPAPLAQSH